MDKRNEPTTGEIVSALRNCPNCGDCLRKDQKCYGNDEEAADRLESQERAIAELTARAESAERERDDVEKSLARRIMKHLGDNEFDSTFVCEICEYNLTNSPKCLSCGSDYHYGENFELKHTLRG